MTNFIYIFMIITLICIGAGIKAFNSEDSDTKTTIKNIPNGIKKVLLIGTNVQKTDITILIGTINYLMKNIELENLESSVEYYYSAKRVSGEELKRIERYLERLKNMKDIGI